MSAAWKPQARDTKQRQLSDAERTMVPFTASAWAAFTRSLKQ